MYPPQASNNLQISRNLVEIKRRIDELLETLIDYQKQLDQVKKEVTSLITEISARFDLNE